jgi:Hydrolase N-terminal helical domain
MPDFSSRSLAATAGIDPWALRDQLTAGDPDRIHALAHIFGAAAAEQSRAAALAGRGLARAAESYLAGNASPVALAVRAGRPPLALGTSADHLDRVAHLLARTADDLAGRVSAANAQVSGLDAAVARIAEECRGAVGRSRRDAGFRPEAAARQQPFLDRASERVRAVGGRLRESVRGYEAVLAANLRSLSDLGYVADERPSHPEARMAYAEPDRGMRGGTRTVLVFTRRPARMAPGAHG